MSKGRASPVSLFSFQDIITGLCGVLILLVLVMIVDLVSRRTVVPDVTPVPDSGIESLEQEIAELKSRFAEMQERLETLRKTASTSLSKEKIEAAERELSEKDRELANLLAEVETLRAKYEKERDAVEQGREKLREMEAARRTLEARLAEISKHKGITLIPERGSTKSPVYVVLGGKEALVCAPLDAHRHESKFTVSRLGENLRDRLSLFDPNTHIVVLLVRPSGVDYMASAQALVEEMGFSFGRDPLEEDAEISFGKAGGS